MATNQRLQPVIFEDATIKFRNFSGAEGKFSPAGKRTFHLLLDEAQAAAMKADGWNVKFLTPYEEDDIPQAHIEVEARWKGFPPRVILITSRGKTALDESMVNILDWAEFNNIDLIINPSRWEVNGNSGVKAYLKSGYFTLHEDALELKYRDVPDSAQTAMAIEAASDEPEMIHAKSEILSITRGESTPF
jgi:hypothetical protein